MRQVDDRVVAPFQYQDLDNMKSGRYKLKDMFILKEFNRGYNSCSPKA